MATNLFLTQSRARRAYNCDGCDASIQQGTAYFRHDPLNFNPRREKKLSQHWCVDCIATSGAATDPGTGRLRVSVLQVLSNQTNARKQLTLPHLALGRVELIGVGPELTRFLQADPLRVHELTPKQFQEFLCERIDAMGFEPRQVGNVYQKDGGIDILFWPREHRGFPFLGAVQAKHHQDPSRKEGPSAVRDFAGVVAGHPINIGLMVTNTSFTADAAWFARHKAPLLQLREFADIRRWLAGSFSAAEEWRDLPESIEVCPGLVVPVGGTRGR